MQTPDYAPSIRMVSSTGKCGGRGTLAFVTAAVGASATAAAPGPVASLAFVPEPEAAFCLDDSTKAVQQSRSARGGALGVGPPHRTPPRVPGRTDTACISPA